MTKIAASRDAWGYLLSTVEKENMELEPVAGKASKSAYFIEGGTPGGVWIGAGAGALGFTDTDKVSEVHLARLFGEGTHPVTGTALGAKYTVAEKYQDRVGARIGKELPLTMDAEAYAQQLEQIEAEELGRQVKESVAGFEFVFSPPKSVSSWWALADPALKDQIRQAHQEAIQATVQKLERDVARTRLGVNGAAQSTVRGITAATFEHWDSREGDPQLHTHMIVSNKVQGEDGKWRTLDSRWGLSPAVVTLGGYYDGVLMDTLSQKLGVGWTVQEVSDNPEKYHAWLVESDTPDSPSARLEFAVASGVDRKNVKWQIDGVDQVLNETFSTRSAQVRAGKDALIKEYVATHGHQPSAGTVLRMRQASAIRNRQAKKVMTLKELTGSWRTRAAAVVGDTFLFADRIAKNGQARLADRNLWSFRQDDVTEHAANAAAEAALHDLANQKSTWTRQNAEAAVQRVIAPWRFRSPEDRDQVVTRITQDLIGQAIPLTPKNHLHVPTRWKTPDGEDMFHPESRELFTSPQVWDAEERLLESGNTITQVAVPGDLVASRILTETGEDLRILSDDQAEAVTNILTSGREIDLLVGPAGAGKTTSLQKLLEIWEAHNGEGSVRGLAPTARASEVLAESLGIVTENTAKWLYETGQGTTVKDGFSFTINRNDLIIVDEASIAGTMALDSLRDQVNKAGAKLLLVGDWAQLAAVDAGGAFGLLANDRDDVPELVNLHRFKEDWEAAASKLLRLGKVSGLDPYIRHERVSWGLSDTVLGDAVEAWKADESTVKDGRSLTSLLIAPTNEMTTQLNDIARTWRISQGLVNDTVAAPVATGSVSPGDRIVTRQNDRQLKTDHDRWVKNNDEWVVADVLEGGALLARSGEEHVLLPAHYVQEHVQLAYATTAYRSQGRTVDTAHSIVDSSSARETFYVSMTRGKQSNRAYVLIDPEETLEGIADVAMNPTWRETLNAVVQNRSGDTAAHDTATAELDRVTSIKQLAAEYQTIAASVLEQRYIPILLEAGIITEDDTSSPSFGPLLNNLRRVEDHGLDVIDTIQEAIRARTLTDAHDDLAVLHYRLDKHIEQLPDLDTSYLGGVLQKATAAGDPEVSQALQDREDAMQLRAELLVDQALQNSDAWLQAVGPQIVGGEQNWRNRAVTVAFYRDLHGIDDSKHPLGVVVSDSWNRTQERTRAMKVLQLPSKISPANDESLFMSPEQPLSQGTQQAALLRGY